MLDRPSLRRVIDVTRQAERVLRAKPPLPRRPVILQPTKYGRVTTQIPAGTAAGPGHGKGSLLLVKYGADGTAKYDPAPQATGIDFYSFAAEPVTAGTSVIVALIDGRYNVIAELCAATSTPTPTPTPTPSSTKYTPDGYDPDGFTPGGF